MIKVRTNRELLANESTVKVKANTVKFTFDKYNSSGQLSLYLENLKGALDWKGVVKKIKGEFGVFIIKKKHRGKWGDLYAPQIDEDLTLSDIGEREHETLLSQEPSVKVEETPKDENEYGELTNELMGAMYEDKKETTKIRRKSRAQSLVKNFKNIMSKYGNQSRKQLSKNQGSHLESNRRIGEKTSSDMESFLQAESRALQQNLTVNIDQRKSKFGCRSSDQLDKMGKSLNKSNTGNIRLSNLKTRNSSAKKEFWIKDEDEKTDLTRQKEKIKMAKKTNGEFKVLTIDDIMSREVPQHTRKSQKLSRISKKKPRNIEPETVLDTEKNPFTRGKKEWENWLDKVGAAKEQKEFEEELQKHKKKFLSNNIKKRKSIYHQQMSRNHLNNLKKSRKSIREKKVLTYHAIEKRKKKSRRLDNSPSILEELEIEFSNEFPMIQNSSIGQCCSSNQLPVKPQLTSKSQRVVKNRQILRANKSNPRYRNAANKRLRNIEKSFKPKSVSKSRVFRSRSKPYTNKKKAKKGSSVVFTKPKTNKQRKARPKGSSKSQNPGKRGPPPQSGKELQDIFQRVQGKKQQILDTFAGLSLDMGWVHKQCRHMDLESGDGVIKFLEMQNRLIIKLASKLRKEKNSRYKVEQQCQNMMEKFSYKIQ